MCGVIAYVGTPDESLLEKLVYESYVRGTHNKGEYRTNKHSKVGCGIIHTRYCTSGETNQPLVIGSKALAFNGVIDMGTKKEIEKRWVIKMSTDNDGEIILRTCKTPKEVRDFISEITCSFAGVMIMENKLIALRNKYRPLWMSKVGKTIYIASTKDIFMRSGIKKCAELEPLKIYQWTI
jgi:glutamine phosphoribosylpyrophosphate amidotransferase